MGFYAFLGTLMSFVWVSSRFRVVYKLVKREVLRGAVMLLGFAKVIWEMFILVFCWSYQCWTVFGFSSSQLLVGFPLVASCIIKQGYN